MYKVFNRDFARTKYKVASEYYDIMKSHTAPLQYSNNSKIQINAVVNGLGPKFKITLGISNKSVSPIYELSAIIEYNESLFAMKDVTKVLHCLIPKMEYSYVIYADTLCGTTTEEIIKITLIIIGRKTPIGNVIVQIPVSEKFVENF